MTNIHEPTRPSRAQRRRKPGRAQPLARREQLDGRYEEQPETDTAPAGRVFTTTTEANTQRWTSHTALRFVAVGLLALCTAAALAASALDLLSRPAPDVRPALTSRLKPHVRSQSHGVPRQASAAHHQGPTARATPATPTSHRVEGHGQPSASPPPPPATPAGSEEQTRGGPFSP
jgi:hypothetical protein